MASVVRRSSSSESRILSESLGERLMGPLEFDGEVRDTSGGLGQREVCIRGGAGLTRIDCERPENSVVIGQNWLRPRRAYATSKRQLAMLFVAPVRLGRNVFHDDRSLQACGGAAQADFRRNR